MVTQGFDTLVQGQGEVHFSCVKNELQVNM
jgi:hypothetical protein